MRTCQNPTGLCLQDLRGLEGRLKAELRGVGSLGFLGSGLGSILGSKAWGLFILPDPTRSLYGFNLKH